MNPAALLQLFLAGGGKAIAGFSAFLTEIGPAILTLAPDIQQDVADLTKTFTDAATIIGTITGKVSTAVTAAPAAPAAPAPKA
jgi:hypothetical protein